MYIYICIFVSLYTYTNWPEFDIATTRKLCEEKMIRATMTWFRCMLVVSFRDGIIFNNKPSPLRPAMNDIWSNWMFFLPIQSPHLQPRKQI